MKERIPVGAQPSQVPRPAPGRRTPDRNSVLALQRDAGNQAVAAALAHNPAGPLLTIQRDPFADVVTAMNDKNRILRRDGDLKKAWGVLNSLNMTDMLETMERLRTGGQLAILTAHIGEASGFNGARLQVGVDVVMIKAAGKTDDPIELSKIAAKISAVGPLVAEVETFLRLPAGGLTDQHDTPDLDGAKLAGVRGVLEPTSSAASPAGAAWDGAGATPAAAANRAKLKAEITAALTKHLDRALPMMKKLKKAKKLPMTAFEDAGKAAKRVVDATFGGLASSAALTAGQKAGRAAFSFKAGTNLLDRSDPADFTPDAADLAHWMAESDPDAAKARRTHNFDAARSAAELVFLDNDVLKPFVTARKGDLELYDRFGFASADPVAQRVIALPTLTGNTKAPSAGVPSPAERTAKWSMWQTLVHEYIHTLEHPGFSAAHKGRRVMVEGFTTLFSKEVLATEIPKAKGGDPALLAGVEGTDSSGAPFPGFNASFVPSFDAGIYAEYLAGAEKIQAEVGSVAMRAAFFQGHVELAGLTPSGDIMAAPAPGSGEQITPPPGVTSVLALAVLTGSTSAAIIGANPGLKQDSALPMPIRVPGVRLHTVVKSDETSPTGAAVTTVVETPAQIAAQNGVTEPALRRANPGRNWTTLKAGDRVLIPVH